jgi:hypothetical protein
MTSSTAIEQYKDQGLTSVDVVYEFTVDSYDCNLSEVVDSVGNECGLNHIYLGFEDRKVTSCII